MLKVNNTMPVMHKEWGENVRRNWIYQNHVYQFHCVRVAI